MITSALTRVLKLGGLVGRVGTSVVGNRLADLVRPEEPRERRQTETLVKNALRVVETLGELKGAAMKVGQMLSLQDALLPPEVTAVLQTLQRQAPQVPFEVMQAELEEGVPDHARIFRRLEPLPIASASIGQVHRALLRDGRWVAVKIQYPLIDQVISADLKNLKRMLRNLFGLFSKVDFDPVWREVRDRLLEELDYRHEADNMRRMAELHADVPEIIIPGVVDEASGKNVLTMELLRGLGPEEACGRFPAELRSRWGVVLFEFVLRGLLRHRLLHADPNLANFAFLEDGRVAVYDFGCVKRIPSAIATGYARLLLAAIEAREVDVPGILHDMGVYSEARGPLSPELTTPYVELFGRILSEDPAYAFGADEEMYSKLFELGLANWSKALDIKFPRHIIFIDRAIAGHFGNLSRLDAQGPWRELVLRYATEAAGPPHRD